MDPSGFPTSNVPTAAPSITGSVIFADLQKPVTSSLTVEEIDEIISIAEVSFGVLPGNVDADITYDITGSVTLDVSDDVSEEEIVSVLQTSIADALNIHPRDVSVTVDPETGVATYVVTSESAEDALALQESLQTN